MVNNVARLALLHHSPFLHIFQDAAARAYIRVQCSSSSLHTGPRISTSANSFYFMNHPRCALPRMTVFSDSQRTFRRLKSPSPSNLLVQCSRVRHYSSQAQPIPAPLLPVFPLKRNVKKRSTLSQKNQGLGSSSVPMQPMTTGDTLNAAPLSNSRVDSLDRATTPLETLSDDAPSISPVTHNSSTKFPITTSNTLKGGDSLSEQLIHLYMSSPQASIQSLISYHNTFPNLQSTRSYNFLLQLAIRHSAFGTAHALLKSMHASRVPEDQTTWQLYVRLLVREGRWPDACNFVVNLLRNLPRPPFVSDTVPVLAWAELLGTIKRGTFRGPLRSRDPGMHNVTRYQHIMRLLPKLRVSSTDTPLPQVVHKSVAALLRMGEREAARQVTIQFLKMDPRRLGPQLVHLHMAAEPGSQTLRSFYRSLRDLRAFRVLCPELEPNSITLFLLLGHLKRVKQCGMIGHKLVRWFRRRWGNAVISPGVETRLLALAVKEKRMDLIRQWMTCVKTRRKIWGMWSLEREVVDGGVWRSITRHPDLRLVKAGTERRRVDRLLRRASRVLERKREASERGLRRNGYSVADP